MKLIQNTANKLKINQNKDRGHFLQIWTRSQVKVEIPTFYFFYLLLYVIEFYFRIL